MVRINEIELPEYSYLSWLELHSYDRNYNVIVLAGLHTVCREHE